MASLNMLFDNILIPFQEWFSIASTFKSATFYYLPMNQIFNLDFLALVLWLGIQRIDIWDDISWRYISAIQSGWSKQLQSITIPNQWVSIKNSFSTHFTIFISQFTRVLQFWFRYCWMYINRREGTFTLWALEQIVSTYCMVLQSSHKDSSV